MTNNGVEFIGGEESDNKIAKSIDRRNRDLGEVSLIRIVKNLHLARNNRQAEYVLVAIGIPFVLIAFFIVMYFVLDIGTNKETDYIVSPIKQQISTSTAPTSQKAVSSTKKPAVPKIKN